MHPLDLSLTACDMASLPYAMVFNIFIDLVQQRHTVEVEQGVSTAGDEMIGTHYLDSPSCCW